MSGARKIDITCARLIARVDLIDGRVGDWLIFAAISAAMPLANRIGSVQIMD